MTNCKPSTPWLKLSSSQTETLLPELEPLKDVSVGASPMHAARRGCRSFLGRQHLVDRVHDGVSGRLLFNIREISQDLKPVADEDRQLRVLIDVVFLRTGDGADAESNVLQSNILRKVLDLLLPAILELDGLGQFVLLTVVLDGIPVAAVVHEDDADAE